MPTITDTQVTLWAFCPDATCPGYETHEVDGVAREVSRTAFEEAGPGTINGNSVSTSFWQYLVPSGETDEYGYAIGKELGCEHCERTLQVSPAPRPEYSNISGQDPMTLLQRRKEAERGKERDGELAMLKAQLEVQQQQTAALMAALAGNVQEKPARKPREAA